MNPIKKILQTFRYWCSGKFLCDTCQYDYGDACRRQERPNAKVCPDYKKR